LEGGRVEGLTSEEVDVGMMQTPEPERKLLPTICLQPEV
jgi:hypothetical protein